MRLTVSHVKVLSSCSTVRSVRPVRHTAFTAVSQRQLKIAKRALRAAAQDAQNAQDGADAAQQDIRDAPGEGLMTFNQVISDFKEAAAAGPVEPQTADDFASSVEAELTDLRTALEESRGQASELESQMNKLNDQFLRLNADFDNFRKRTASEKQALTVSAKGDLVQALLPVIDNFELAKSQLKVETEGEQKVDSSYQGVYRQMVDIFRGFGLEAVPGEGAPFDPEVHEAIMREESNDVPDGTVLQEFRKGFKLGDKLLRPAMVKVSFREDANGAAAAAGAAVEEKEQAAAQ